MNKERAKRSNGNDHNNVVAAIRATAGMVLPLILFGSTGCNGNPPTHQQVQEQAAQTTVAVKQDAKEAVDATRKAAAVAESDVNDVATGVRKGLHEKTASPSAKVNLNSASQVRLAMLPGISFTKAGEIVNNRPYSAKKQLVARGILTAAELAKISPEITLE